MEISHDRSNSIDLKQIVALAKELGIFILSLPVAHVGHYPVARQGSSVPGVETVVRHRKQVPTGALVTKELRPGQLLSQDWVFRNEDGDDWQVFVHSHDSDAELQGDWHVKRMVLRNSANLTQIEAIRRARKEFTGK